VDFITEQSQLVLAISFLALWLSAWMGWSFRRRRGDLDAALREDFGFILAATLTLLGLIIGFSFSMATSRYDQRKIYEEAEANAIGTEYVRADLLPAADAAAVRLLMALVVSGMNDVLNSQGYTQAGYWNRIPIAAWGLMAAIAIGCNLLVGYGSHGAKSGSKLLPILPLIVAIAFMLIADIDSPRRGIILVRPQNLISLAESLPPGGTP
jgi:hypothetical protein